MVKIMENLIKMDDLGGKNHPYFWFNTQMDVMIWFCALTVVDSLQDD